MYILFDLNGTVFGSLDSSLRPGIMETISGLREKGFKVHFWTSGPIDYYLNLLRIHGISGEIYPKVKALPFSPEICIDDEPMEWMPGRVFKVKPHISEDLPGEAIDFTALLFNGDSNFFYWD